MFSCHLVGYNRETKLAAGNICLLNSHADRLCYAIYLAGGAESEISLIKGENTIKLADRYKSLTGIFQRAEHTEGGDLGYLGGEYLTDMRLHIQNLIEILNATLGIKCAQLTLCGSGSGSAGIGAIQLCPLALKNYPFNNSVGCQV